MQPPAARHSATATGGPDGPIPVSTGGADTIETAVPGEAESPNGRWNPDALLMATVADGFVATFRSVARDNGLEWRHLTCHAEDLGTIDDDPETVDIALQVEVIVPGESQRADATRSLNEAEQGCRITQLLRCRVRLSQQVTVSAD